MSLIHKLALAVSLYSLLLYLFLSDFSFVGANIFADDHTAVMLPRTRGRVRHHLQEARIRRHQDASPGHQLPSLPPLLSTGDITRLREQIEPISFSYSLCIVIVFNLFIF